MTKEVFLRELGRKLRQLSDKEVKQQLSYYEELLNDMMEDGMLCTAVFVFSSSVWQFLQPEPST